MNDLNDIVVIGCGGHSRFVISMALDNKFSIKGLLDTKKDFDESETIMGYKVIGSLDLANDLYQKGIKYAVIAVGDNILRENIYQKLIDIGFNTPNIVHSSAYVNDSSSLGEANVIGPNAVIGSKVKIGNNNIINTGAIIEHQSELGNGNHLSLSAVLCGNVSISNNVFIGANSTIIENISISDDVVIGAGTTIIHNIEKKGALMVGNKARLIEK